MAAAALRESIDIEEGSNVAKFFRRTASDKANYREESFSRTLSFAWDGSANRGAPDPNNDTC